MVDAVGELIAAAGQAIVEDNKFLDDKKKSPIILRVLYYLVPMSILTGSTSGLLTTDHSICSNRFCSSGTILRSLSLDRSIRDNSHVFQ